MNDSNKKIFCTFADSRMKESLKRIKDQAYGMNFFDEIYICNEKNLDPNFKNIFKDKLIRGSRGYGYWVWKPQIILQILSKMNEGDILLYTDAGCHLNKNGLEKLKYYFTLTNESDTGLLVFQEAIKSEDESLEFSNEHLEKKYTKGDIFEYFGVTNIPEISDTGMIAATAFFIKKQKNSVEIIEKWLQVFENNFNLVDDSPSNSENFPEFIENRHDQSIFSMLCKINNVKTISAYEMWHSDWNKLNNYPILAKRDRGLKLYWKINQRIVSYIMKNKKIKKLIEADNSTRVKYFKRFFNNIFSKKVLPVISIVKYPFVSKEKKVNVYLDFLETITHRGPKIRQRYYQGFKLFYGNTNLGTGIVNHIKCDQIYEPETCGLLENSIKNIPKPTFIDIGANIGLISLYMLDKFPDLDVYAFEPSPYQHDLFEMTIKENKLADRVSLYKSAVSNENGHIKFFKHNEANCSGDGIKNTNRGGAGDFIEVKTIKLDSWWEEKNKPKIDLIKIDVEGAEFLVFQGAINLITECKPVLFFEMQESNYKFYDYDWKNILDLLEPAGYSIYTENNEKLTRENAESIMQNNYNFIAKQ